MRARPWGWLYAKDKEAAFRELEEVLELYDGNLSRTAHALGYHRRNLYLIIHRDGDRLWPVIDRIRAAVLVRIEARRRMLTGV